MYKVKIPATSANLGPGFDCLGVALNLYNIIEVEEIGEGLKIEMNGNVGKIPTNENNLVYKSMKAVFDKVGYFPKGLRIIQTNGIPMTRGLGSSAACIVGGIYAANYIVNKELSSQELAVLAASLDGHPDNTTPAIMGGMVVSVLEGNALFHASINIPDNLKFVAFIPEFTLSTVKARMILPERIFRKDAVFSASRAALLAASLANGKIENLSCALNDKLHQPYRKKLIPGMEKIFEKCIESGAVGCYLSGAGPTLIAILESEYDEFCSRIKPFLNSLRTSWELKMLDVDVKGVEEIVN